MTYGVYGSGTAELAVTEHFIYYLYKNAEGLGARLYFRGELAAACFRRPDQTLYAFSNRHDEIKGNAPYLFEEAIPFPEDLPLLEPLEMADPRLPQPTVDEAGIEGCLRSWRNGARIWAGDEYIRINLVTNKIEYECSMKTENDNIYCGASVNIPCSKGLAGGHQYFRFRNHSDNSQPWCRFYAEFDKREFDWAMDENRFIPGQCAVGGGLYWGVKRYTQDEIVLQGCGEDEYRIRRDSDMLERYQ